MNKKRDCFQGCRSVLESLLLIKKSLLISEPGEMPENAALAVKHIPPKLFKLSADCLLQRVQLVKTQTTWSAEGRWLVAT